MKHTPIYVDFNDQQFADLYDELPLWSSQFGYFLLENIPLQTDSTVLDIGCGTGFPLFELAGRLGNTSHIVGLDVWLAALNRANQKRLQFNQTSVSLVGYDGTTFPFQDNIFNLIISNLGVNNFANPRQTVQECYRVTKAGGYLALTTNLNGHMGEFYKIFRQVLVSFGNDVYLQRLDTHKSHRGTTNTVSDLLTNNRYTFKDMNIRHFVMRYANGSALLSHPFIRFAFLPSWLSIVDPHDQQTIFEQLERDLNSYASHHGELRLTIPMLYMIGVAGK